MNSPQPPPMTMNLPLYTIADKCFNIMSIVGIDFGEFPPFFGQQPPATAPEGIIRDEDMPITAQTMTIRLALVGGFEYEFVGPAATEFWIWWLQCSGQSKIAAP